METGFGTIDMNKCSLIGMFMMSRERKFHWGVFGTTRVVTRWDYLGVLDVMDHQWRCADWPALRCEFGVWLGNSVMRGEPTLSLLKWCYLAYLSGCWLQDPTRPNKSRPLNQASSSTAVIAIFNLPGPLYQGVSPRMPFPWSLWNKRIATNDNCAWKMLLSAYPGSIKSNTIATLFCHSVKLSIHVVIREWHLI